MAVLPLAEGPLFVGRYRIVRVIAHGGMGAVYEVVHTETDRHRALKVILPSFLQSEEMPGRFGSAKLVAEGAT
jgi:serine/threonine protein kinase